MATLTIRNLPEHVRDNLRVRAAQNGRSMEAEARTVLTESVSGGRQSLSRDEIAQRVRDVQKVFEKYKKPDESVVDEFLAHRRQMWGEE